MWLEFEMRGCIVFLAFFFFFCDNCFCVVGRSVCQRTNIPEMKFSVLSYCTSHHSKPPHTAQHNTQWFSDRAPFAESP